MKNFLATLFLFVIAFAPQQLLACGGKHTVHSVKMERTSCFGKCPAYIIEIDESGLVKYWGKKDAPRQGYYEAMMDKSDAQALLKKFTKKKIREAQNEYSANIADVPMLHYTFVVGKDDELKNVRQANFGPRYFYNYAQLIDAAVANVQWVRASDNAVE